LAQELEIPRVIVPPIPGGFSALGLVASDFRRDYVKTFYTRLDEARLEDVAAVYARMEAAGREGLGAAGVPGERWGLTRAGDCRYGRQAYELTVPVAPGAVTDKTLARLAADFHDRHRQTYGHASPDEAVPCVNLRLAAVGHQAGLELSRRPDPDAAPRTAAAREAYFKETGLVH